MNKEDKKTFMSGIIEMRKLSVEMYKEGYLEGYLHGRHPREKISEIKKFEIWKIIEKEVWKKFKKRFIHNRTQKGGKK